MIRGDLGNLYAGEPEDLPHSCRPPMGNPVLIYSFVDANLMDDLTISIFKTVIIHLLNKTTIYWYYKSQYCDETTTYGSKYSTTRICTDHIVGLCNNLRYLGVPFQMVNWSDASFMLGDNFSFVNSTVMPAGKLQRRSHIINYHCTKKAQAKVVIRIMHMNGNDNLTGIVTNICSYNTWFILMNPLLFWSDMDFLKERVVAEGNENNSSTRPLSQFKGIPQQ